MKVKQKKQRAQTQMSMKCKAVKLVRALIILEKALRNATEGLTGAFESTWGEKL